MRKEVLVLTCVLILNISGVRMGEEDGDLVVAAVSHEVLRRGVQDFSDGEIVMVEKSVGVVVEVGSTRLTTSETGASVTEVQYKPFGEQINTTEDDEDGLIQIVEWDFEGDGSLEVLKNIRPDQNTGLDIYLLFFFSLIELPSLLIKSSLPIISHEQIQQNNPH